MPFSLDPPPREDELECARCGAYFYYDLTRCPECGVNIYAPEDEFDIDAPDKPTKAVPLHGLFHRLKNILRRISGKPYAAQDVFGDSLDQAVLYNDLLAKAGGDHHIVERLITFEQQQNPQATRKTCLENAIQRWERDNQIPFSTS